MREAEMGYLSVVYVTRPYSWVYVVSLALLANTVAVGGLVLNISLLEDVFIALFLWVTGLLFVEYGERETDKRVTSLFPFFISFSLLVLLLIYRNIYTLAPLFITLFCGIFYGSKNKDLITSKFSFLFRGVWEVCVFLIILFSHHNYNIAGNSYLLLVIYFLTTSRNLVGDIRDINYDKYTFPKKYGIKVSYFVSEVLIIMSAFLIKNVLVMIPLLIYIVLLLLSNNAYLLHRLFVVSSTFFLMNYVLFLIHDGQMLFLVNILFIGVLLNFTYDLTPRKSNKDWGIK